MPREPGWARRSWKRAGWDLSLSHAALYLHLHHGYIHSPTIQILDCYPVCARSALAQRACALGAKGLLLADGAPTVGLKKLISWRKPCSGHNRKKLFKEKSCLFPNKYQSLKKFWVIFWVITHFWPKTTFRPNIIPARTGSVVILGHFFSLKTVQN